MPLSPAFRRASFASASATGLLWLCRITHPDLPATFAFVNNLRPITSRNFRYEAFPFTVLLPSRREEGTGLLKLAIDNVDTRIVEAARTLRSPADVTVEAVLMSNLNETELGPYEGRLARVPYDMTEVEIELAVVSDDEDQFPKDRYDGRFNALSG